MSRYGPSPDSCSNVAVSVDGAGMKIAKMTLDIHDKFINLDQSPAIIV